MELFERTRALAGFRLRPSGDQVVANLWKTLDVARAYEAAGPTTLRALVRFLEEEAEGGEATRATRRWESRPGRRWRS